MMFTVVLKVLQVTQLSVLTRPTVIISTVICKNH